MKPNITKDTQLLDSAYREEWKHRDSWRALRILSEFVEGFDTLADPGAGGLGLRVGANQARYSRLPVG